MALGSSDSKSLLCLFLLGMFPDLSYKIENEVLLKDIFHWKNFALFLDMQKYCQKRRYGKEIGFREGRDYSWRNHST